MSEVLKDGLHYGYDIPQDINFNLAEFKRKRDEDMKRFNGAYEQNWNRENIDFVEGTATFKGQKEIEVDGTSYNAPHILIAFGG